MKATIGYVTDRGLNPRRTRNEDNLLVMPERGLYLVADGVGGRRGGEMASRMVVDVFRRVFNQPQFIDDHRAVLLSTIDLCNQKIYEASQSNPDLEGMATTIAAVVVDGPRAMVVHVGDSRVYRVDGQGLIMLTEDHSEVNEALRAGRITAELAATHPKRNVINRALGADSEVEPDLISIELDEQTSLLLCTDGVTRHLDDDRLADLLQSGHHPQTLCQLIRERCYDEGAEDNLTAIVIDFGRRSYIEDARPVVERSASPVIEVDLRPDVQNWASEDPQGVADADLVREESWESSSLRGEERDRSEPPTLREHPGRTPLANPANRISPASRVPADTPPAADFADFSDVDQYPEWSAQAEDPEPEDEPGEDSVDEPGADDRAAGRSVGGWLGGLRWSLLVVGLAVGAGFGWLVGPPLAEWFTSLFGARTIYDQRGIEHPPKDPEVNSAYASHLDGKTVEARQRLNQFLIVNPNHPEGNLFLGIIEYDEGNYEQAISRIQLAVRLDPRLPNARIRLAMAYLSTGQMRTARDVLQELVSPNSPGGPLLRGTPAPIASPPAGGTGDVNPVKPVG